MNLVAYDPWTEFIDNPSQPRCRREGLPPAADPEGFLSQLKESWADSVLFGSNPSPSLLKNPLRNAHPIGAALSHLALQKKIDNLPPLRRIPSVLPIAERCQLALLLGIAGEEGEALGRKLLPFLSFPTLWCPEGAYREKEALWSIALLLRAFGKFVAIGDRPDPFFVALAKNMPRWESAEGEPADVDAFISRGPASVAAFATAGEKIPLGAALFHSLEIPAFGPHAYPLSDPSLFGIRRSFPDRRWAAAAGKPDVWFEIDPDLSRGLLQTRFLGHSMENPIAFAFFIKAERAEIERASFLPKSLQRYSGGAKRVEFSRRGIRTAIVCEQAPKMELIPLAGEGCFWNADFLLAFEIPPFDGRAQIHITTD
jgi:hypothetical protein